MILALAAMALAAAQNTEAPRVGFSAAELAQRPSRRDTPSIRSALARAEAIRGALILDPARTTQIVDAIEARALESALGRVDQRSAAQISYFMRGAVTRVTPAGSAIVAGYYNPLLDVWLVTRLERLSGEWRVTRARTIDGAASRAAGTLWTQAHENPFSALAENYRHSIASFDQGFRSQQTASVSSDAFGLLGERTTSWMGSLAAWRQDVAALGAAEEVRSAIAAGRLQGTGLAAEGLAREIDALPLSIRRTYAITGSARRGELVSLILVSPIAPELLLVLDIDAQRHPRTISVINLGNAQGEGGT